MSQFYQIWTAKIQDVENKYLKFQNTEKTRMQNNIALSFRSELCLKFQVSSSFES